ncbi:Complement C1q-like protein 4 [Bagarius yarrelli]|uniref:Complement C1q-like protein 4 n=1 Tax=Bagarius yarrelli TaxID=175774 RepID=A0A556U7C1_BAGYA|nr:Complement C1q-like protein 4 [Bagarius yarrelli]
MKVTAVVVLGLLGTLTLFFKAQASTSLDVLWQAAANWTGTLPCGGWDCQCLFRNPKGCCCVAVPVFQLEEATFMRMMGLWKDLNSLNNKIQEITGGRNVAFMATMTPITGCFGPFNKNVSISYCNVSLNQAYGYNPALGTFTAPRAGLYSFSYTVYSNVGAEGERLYHRVQLMKDGQVIASSWEDNREDAEDSASQTVLLPLKQGNQVYLELVLGRFLCADTQGYNSFSGYLVYPLSDI